MSSETPRCELILALDVETREEALNHLHRLGNSLKWVKVGLQLFTQYGPDIVHQIADQGYHIFLDLKLHDIPNTVAKTVQNLCHLPVSMTTLHTLGSSAMLQAANQARLDHNPDMNLLGVTVLTSMDRSSLAAVGLNDSPEDQVVRLAHIGQESGLQGLVCAPLEITSLRHALGSDCILVTPGIRPVGSSKDDQKRSSTPVEAARQGSSYIVVGRPILQAEDPQAMAHSIQQELAAS